MASSLKQELLESAVVDIQAFDNLEQSELVFGLPLWMTIMIALVIALAGIQAVKLRINTDSSSSSNSSEKSGSIKSNNK